MTVNREAFRGVHELITSFPELHDQRSWEAPPEKTGKCGTTRCIAGWATWWKACEMGLLSQKRQPTDEEIRKAVARELGIGSAHHEYIGAAVLGLDEDQAEELFQDFNSARAVVRVKAYADTGEDISIVDYSAFD